MARWSAHLMIALGALGAALAAAAATAPSAHADAYYGNYNPTPPPPKDEFWREVVAPHGDEIALILQKAQLAFTTAQQLTGSEYDATGEQRARFLDDAYGMLKYARRLDPRQTDVLMWLGQVAEESGRAAAAVEAYQAYLTELDPDLRPPSDVHLRLGRAYLRLGRTDDAIRHFRTAQVDVNLMYGQGASAVAYLGLALMSTDRMPEALDVLSVGKGLQSLYYAEATQLAFTLAVAYDRDEQISAAFEVLDDLANQLGGVGGHHGGYNNYAVVVMQAIGQMTFVPAHDQHYFLALFYESAGYLAEARTEWLLYAQADDAPFRKRALDHVAAIDELLAERLADAAKAAKTKKGSGVTITPAPAPYPYPYP